MSPNNKNQEENGEDVSKIQLLYGLEEIPPWYLTFFLSVQQFLTCFGAVFLFPIIIGEFICLNGDEVGLGELINTVIFVCGLASILQTTFGVRLPIIQGASFSFITPIIVLMKNKQCPTFTVAANGTLPFEPGSSEHRDLWQANLNEASGALMVASIIQMVIGFSGLIGVLVRMIGPLTVAPTICLIGLSLFQTASDKGATHWWICFVTIFLITLFSQYLQNIGIPFVGGTKLKIFTLFPVLLGMVFSWLICLILTETDALPNDSSKWGYYARTDIRSSSLKNAEWFRFPYPGQWGAPVVTASGFVGMFAASIASMIESVGDYYACARLCGVKSPPASAVNRGIGMEGLACFLAGAWGAGGGNTSYSENIGAIGITKVGSRFVVQVAGVIMIVLGCFGKFGALFVMMPDPVVAGLFYVMFGMVTAVGISNLQFVDLNSTRNLFVFGFSIFFGLSVPRWVSQNGFDVGNDTANQILDVICGTNMLVGGVIAFILDSTIPGTRKERGLLNWGQADGDDTDDDMSVYGMPLIQPYLDKSRITRYIPFCLGFFGDQVNKSKKDTNEKTAEEKTDEESTIGDDGVDNKSYLPEKVETSL